MRQPVDGYRVAIDPVLLAAAVPVRAGESVLDLGCGVGAAALCLLARQPEARVLGLEIQPDLAALAASNAEANGAASHFSVVAGDLLTPPLKADGAGFDHVMANPPYLSAESARRPDNHSRAIANVEGAARLANWVAAALALCRPRGTITFIHRADRLDRLLAALTGQAGAIVVFPLWPMPGKDAKRVLVQARKDIKTPTRMAAGLTLHVAGGGFTQPAEAVLRGETPLTL
ncbi:methyltransferase domain-containing protein [Ferruginivarius sediminum]|uniref:Methyltransferase domain-containing protein n=2 Tax=Ferruginivarius sediminum TaxID=2661937 RepID=A0A369TDD8_9PROT|nr:methyltransferase domain-containing protein [Ferruginivarius sediminum]